MSFDHIPDLSGGASERGLGSDFDSISREILLSLLDDLDEGKIDKEKKQKFDAAAAAINEARAAGTRDEALRILAGAAIDESISDERYKRMKAALEAPESARTIHPDTELKSLVGEGGEGPVEQGAETPEIDPEQAEAVAREAVDMLTGTPDAARVVVEGAVPADTPPLEKEKLVEELATKEVKRELTARIAGYLKHLASWEFIVGAGVGGATRAATKAGIVTVFGSSLGTGIVAGALVGSAAGAVGGALTGGVREMIRERGGIRKKFTAESVLEKLRGAKTSEELAAVLFKAEDAYKKARVAGSEGELGVLADELRAARIFADEEIKKLHSDRSVSDDKLKLLGIISASEKIRRSIPKTSELRKNAEELISQVSFEKKKVNLRKVGRAVLRGAAVGAVGGAIGGALADYLSHTSFFSYISHLFGHGASVEGGGLPEVAAPKLAMPRPFAPPSTAEAFHQEFLMRKAEAAAAATKESLEKAQAEILERKFGAVVEKGEGATHVARKIIHDYLANQKLLNPDSFEDPSLEQLVYMEDTLKPIVSEAAKKGFSVGDQFELTGENVAKAFGKASKLMPKQIDHLKELLQEASHRISSKNIEMMTNLDDVRDVGNQFSDEVIKKAQEAAAKAAAEIHEAVLAPQVEAAIQEVVPPPQIPVTEAAQEGGKEAAKLGGRFLAPKILELAALLGAAAAAGGGLGYGTYKVHEKVMASKSKKEAAKQAEGAEREDTAVADWESEGGAGGAPRVDVEAPVRWEHPKREEATRRVGPETVESERSEAAPGGVFLSGLKAAKKDVDDQLGRGEISSDEHAVAAAKIEEMKKKKAGVLEGQPEKPKNTEAQFNSIASSYMEKGVRISAVDDSARAALISRSSEISKVVEKVGAKRFDGYVINFFKPVYGGSARMFMGDRETETKKSGKVIGKKLMRVLNVNIDSSIESIKKFIEDNITKGK